MFDTTPNAIDYLDAPWETFEPYYTELESQAVNEETLNDWLAGWS
jgi:hypothetical protein